MTVPAPAIFVRGDISFSLDDSVFQFHNRHVSLFGIKGLPWSPLNPQKHFGEQIVLNVRLGNDSVPKTIRLKGTITRELTLKADLMGIKFQHEKGSLEELRTLINTYGFCPREFARGSPRIPKNRRIPSYPTSAMAKPFSGKGLVRSVPIVFEVLDLSPHGLLIGTQNPLAYKIDPGYQLEIFIDPRGDFSRRVALHGMVRRILDHVDPFSGNRTRLLGIKTERISEEQKLVYRDLLREILEWLKKNPDKVDLSKRPELY